MKKVELITLQDVPNYGSVLQAYATQKTLEKLGCECEIIRYTPERMTKLGMLKNIKHKSEKFEKSLLWRTAARFIIFPSYIKRFRTFKKFRKKYLNETSKTYRTNEEIKAAKLKADIYCTGSDQVWNSGWNGGIDKAMFLDFAPKNAKCITYAASFGKNKLDKNEIKQTKKLLEKYESISVRESSAVDILKDLGIKSTNVVDPTLLLSGDEWRELSSNKFKNEKYILVYNLNRKNKIDEYAQKVAKKNSLKVKYISYQLHEKYKKGKVYCSPSIEDFIALIDNAQLVVSDSFHATAFSVNLNTDFAIVLPDKYGTRLHSLLRQLGLMERIVTNDEKLPAIDFARVNKKMELMRAESEEWLSRSVSENKKNKQPLISIVIPAYNAEQYIERCAKSIIAQTYNSIEIILVNDGSTDNTLKIMKRISEEDGRVIVIDKENGGVSSARIAGLNRANGKYVMFVDSDDYVDNDYVQYFLDLITYNGGDYDMAVDFNKYSIHTPSQTKVDETTVLSSNRIATCIYASKIHEAVWNKIYKKSFLDKNKLSFDKNIWYGEGMLFNIQCLQKTDKVPVGNRRVYHQYYNRKSAMRNFSMESNKCGLRSLELQRKCWKKEDNDMINAWNFHKYCFNMSILRGILKTNSKNKYKNEYIECKRGLRNGWKYPWKAKVSLKRKAFFIASSLAPVMSARVFIYNEKRAARKNEGR